MLQFIGAYNYDFALAAAPIQLILLLYWIFRGTLPIRSSTSFLVAMVTNLIMIVSDVAACEIIAIYDQYPLWVSYVVNMVYFGAFVVRSWALFDYAANECHAYKAFGKNSRPFLFLPALAVLILTLVTPFVTTIFSMTPGMGYQSGPLYRSIYVIAYAYIAMSLLAVVFSRMKNNKHMRWGILAYNLILAIGLIFRKQFENTLVMPYFSILAVLVIYLSAQNPDLSWDRKTGLLNRHAFGLIVPELQDLSVPFSCMTIVIDNYEQMRELYGLNQLALSLELAGQWFRQTFPDCHAFYWGSGHFVLLHPGPATQNCEQSAQRVIERFEHHWNTSEAGVLIPASVVMLSADLMPGNVEEVTSIINHAFQHAGLLNGHGGYAVTQGMLDVMARERAVAHALSNALREKRIEVYLQPIYSTNENRIVGAEALARLNDPSLGFIPPPEFINMAEKNGDILELGRQIFERVCIFLEKEEPTRFGIRTINVNLSPAQCLSDQLATDLSDIAGAHNVGLETFDFEVTESSIGDLASIGRQLAVLSDAGSTFALDDFGTGVSNLTRLMGLPINVVKLDVDVVQSYFLGKSTLLPDLVQMFRNAGMKTVLEGVETAEMMEGANLMGADYQQGYYFSRPLPPDQFVDYLKSQMSA